MSHPSRYALVNVTCLSCGRAFQTRENRVAAGRGKYCSRACLAKATHTGLPKPKSRENIQLANARRAELGNEPWNKQPLLSLTCAVCGNGFQVPQRRRTLAKYCSTVCHHEAKRRVTGTDHPLWRREQRECEQCGKVVWVNPAKLKEFRFCSRGCHGAYVAAQRAKKAGPTELERLVCQELERRKVPYHWQHPAGSYLLDVAFPKCRLAVELDGTYWHGKAEQQARDARKDLWLRSNGWRILRLPESEVRANVSACVDRMEHMIGGMGTGPKQADSALAE